MSNDTLYNAKTLAYKGVFFNVHSAALKNKAGASYRFEAVEHPGAAVVLPLLSDESFIMLRCERPAIGKTLWELPAGLLDPNEAPEKAAARELIEETGYKAGHIEHQVSFYTSPGMSNEMIHGYSAKNLTFVGQCLEAGEKLSVEIMPWKEVLHLIKQGAIADSKTLALLLFYHFNHL